MTREEFQEMFISMQKELHERAIRGDFTPQNLEKIDWKKEGDSSSAIVTSASSAAEPLTIATKQGWDKIHPLDEGDDGDEEDSEESVVFMEGSEEQEAVEMAHP